MSNASPKARQTHRVYSLTFKQQVVQETFEPGTSASIVARRYDMNANGVFEWKRLYREGKLKLPGIEASSTSSTELLPVNVIDLPVPMPRPAHVTANESALEAGKVSPSTCEIEVEIGKRRVRIRGLSVERAEMFLQECLK